MFLHETRQTLLQVETLAVGLGRVHIPKTAYLLWEKTAVVLRHGRQAERGCCVRSGELWDGWAIEMDGVVEWCGVVWLVLEVC